MTSRALALTLLLAVQTGAEDDNIFANGALEDAAGWRIGAPHSIVARRAPGSSGSRSLLLEGPGEARAEVDVPLRGADLMPLVDTDDAWTALAPILRTEGLRGTLDWTELQLSVEVPEGAYRAKVLLDWQDTGTAAGRVWLDNVSLRWSRAAAPRTPPR